MIYDSPKIGQSPGRSPSAKHHEKTEAMLNGNQITKTRKLASIYVKKCYDGVKLQILSNDLELPGHPKLKFFRDGFVCL